MARATTLKSRLEEKSSALSELQSQVGLRCCIDVHLRKSSVLVQYDGAKATVKRLTSEREGLRKKLRQADMTASMCICLC